jgi:hypothetical protein
VSLTVALQFIKDENVVNMVLKRKIGAKVGEVRQG